jgi:hypothetical protein
VLLIGLLIGSAGWVMARRGRHRRALRTTADQHLTQIGDLHRQAVWRTTRRHGSWAIGVDRLATPLEKEQSSPS